jgi:hypothetical protein
MIFLSENLRRIRHASLLVEREAKPFSCDVLNWA